ncbi:hypothetical protein ACYCFC_10905 [Stutzerimonas sp. NM35]|uniref:hypothetical protein n=1 Tax=Stutzerimonas stutzeri TaxID=316 RepID=UPI0015E37D39|nr:hypothetical protein [Stutzerimonas stutzeri]MBA1264693.1 hypothetical protein [Stutzerimonas stutzeri]
MSEKPKKVKLNKKDSQLLIRISSTEREQFVQLCEQLDTSAAREIRQFIRGFIKKHKPTDRPTSKETFNVQESRSQEVH